MKQPREYQLDAIIQTKQLYDSGVIGVVMVMPCRTGKTYTAVYGFVQPLYHEKKSVLILTIRKEIRDQWSEELVGHGIPHGIIAPGHIKTTDNIQLASIDTVKNRLDEWPFFDLVIYDECHISTAKTHKAALLHYREAGSKLLGLTATPRRLDNKGLSMESGGCFDEMVQTITIKGAIDNHSLVPLKIITHDDLPDLSGVNVSMGDFNKKKIIEIMGQSKIVGDAVKEYREHAHGKQCVIFTTGIKDGEIYRNEFINSGYKAEIVTGKTPAGERSKIIQRFRDGEISHLVSINVVQEGFNVPGIEAVIDTRPTLSTSGWLQRIMRCMTPAEGKLSGILIDMVGNVWRHGLPWQDHHWTLEGVDKKARKKDDELLDIARCTECFQVYDGSLNACPICGAGKKTRERVIKKVSGELKIITEAEFLEIMKQRQDDQDEKEAESSRKVQMKLDRNAATSLSELYQVAVKYNYKKSWAEHFASFRAEKLDLYIRNLEHYQRVKIGHDNIKSISDVVEMTWKFNLGLKWKDLYIKKLAFMGKAEIVEVEL